MKLRHRCRYNSPRPKQLRRLAMKTPSMIRFFLAQEGKAKRSSTAHRIWRAPPSITIVVERFCTSSTQTDRLSTRVKCSTCLTCILDLAQEGSRLCEQWRNKIQPCCMQAARMTTSNSFRRSNSSCQRWEVVLRARCTLKGSRVACAKLLKEPLCKTKDDPWCSGRTRNLRASTTLIRLPCSRKKIPVSVKPQFSRRQKGKMWYRKVFCKEGVAKTTIKFQRWIFSRVLLEA